MTAVESSRERSKLISNILTKMEYTPVKADQRQNRDLGPSSALPDSQRKSKKVSFLSQRNSYKSDDSSNSFEGSFVQNSNGDSYDTSSSLEKSWLDSLPSSFENEDLQLNGKHRVSTPMVAKGKGDWRGAAEKPRNSFEGTLDILDSFASNGSVNDDSRLIFTASPASIDLSGISRCAKNAKNDVKVHKSAEGERLLNGARSTRGERSRKAAEESSQDVRTDYLHRGHARVPYIEVSQATPERILASGAVDALQRQNGDDVDRTEVVTFSRDLYKRELSFNQRTEIDWGRRNSFRNKFHDEERSRVKSKQQISEAEVEASNIVSCLYQSLSDSQGNEFVACEHWRHTQLKKCFNALRDAHPNASLAAAEWHQTHLVAKVFKAIVQLVVLRKQLLEDHSLKRNGKIKAHAWMKV